MLLWLAILLGGAVVGVVALLCVPLDMDLRAQRQQRFAARWRLRWLFGIVRIEHPADALGDSSPAQAPAAPEPEAADQRPTRKAAVHPRARALAATGTRGFVRRVATSARALVRCMRVREFRLWARLGFEDPADTGMLWGALGPVAAIAQATSRQVILLPDFAQPAFQFDCVARLRLVPIRVVGVLLAFALSPVTLRAAWAAGRAGRP